MARFGSARWWTAVAVSALVATSCSSGSKRNTTSTSTTRAQAAHFTPAAPEEVIPPPHKGQGLHGPLPAPPTPSGYVENEFFVGGTATSFRSVSTPSNGEWTVTPAKTAKYRTRVIVFRPPAAKFSGTVIVEWFNVTALESDPDWAYLSEEIGREGDAYIGVSAQAQGVEGGKTLLNANVNQKTAASFGASANKSGLKHIDPVRYGTLVHPGDAYAYDIFSQVGRAAAADQGGILGGLEPKRVLAVGESQSAAFLTTLVDAIHPVDPAFNGFLIHSRFASAAPLNGIFAGNSNGKNPLGNQVVLIRTDLNVPVFMFETETDLTLLGYSPARQPDTKFIHTWEVAGTSHADAHLIRVVIGGPRDPKVGSLLGCGSVNTGPQHEVVQAALHQFVVWASTGVTPPTGTRLQLTKKADGEVSIARDGNGNALGGVRNPLVDAPTATLTGEPPSGTTAADLAKGNGTCFLFGETIPFSRAKLDALYGNADKYVADFRAAAGRAVAGGFLLQPDADALIAEAQANRARFR
jgi:hypothetical protein